jgi:hypothetical protein
MDMKIGAIVILDLLGGKLEDESSIVDFLDVRSEMTTIFLGKAEKSAEVKGISLEVKVYTFGDSIIFALSNGNDSDSDSVLRSAILSTRQVLAYSIERGLPFRGSISYGKFYANDISNTVLGPAVNDAATWHDKTEIIGVVATPSTTLKILSDHELDADKAVGKQRYCYMTVIPNKLNYTEKLGYVNWPTWIAFDNKGKKPRVVYSLILSMLSSMRQPPQTEVKYNNTIKIVRKILRIT